MHREVFIREQTPLPGLLEYRLEEGFSNIPIEQPLAVLGEHGHIPDGVVHVQAHEPAEQQVIVELFHQQPFAAHRVQRLQQQRSQQFLRRDRWPPGFRVQLTEPWLQFSQGLIGHDTKPTQGVVLGYSLLRAYVAEHIQLLLVLSTHTLLLIRLVCGNKRVLWYGARFGSSFSAARYVNRAPGRDSKTNPKFFVPKVNRRAY